MMAAMTVLAAGAATTGAVLAGLHASDVRRQQAATRREAAAAELEAAGASRQRWVELVQRVGLRRAAELEFQRPPWAQRSAAIEHQRAAAEREQQRRKLELVQREQHLSGSRLPAGHGTAFAAAVVWAAAVLLSWELERSLISSMGYPGWLAAALATIIAIVVEALGFVFFAALGVHPFELVSGATGKDDARSRARKVSIAGACLTALAALLVTGIAPLAAARAGNAFAGKVNSAAAELAAARAGGDATIIETATLTYNEQVEGRRVATTMDVLYTSSATLVVFLFSWAPLHAAEHAAVVGCRRRLRRADEAFLAAGRDEQTLQRDFLTSMATRLDEAGIAAESLEAMLDRAPAPLPPVAVADADPSPAPSTTVRGADHGAAVGHDVDETPGPPPYSPDPVYEPNPDPQGPPPDPFNLFPGADTTHE